MKAMNCVKEMVKTGEPMNLNAFDTEYRNRYYDSNYDHLHDSDSYVRSEYNERYCFPIITKEFLQEFKEKFGNRKILEVGSGSGYIAYQLQKLGIKIIPTDNKEWVNLRNSYYEKWRNEFTKVLSLDALNAINIYKDECDAVMFSWPPYNEPIGAKVAEACKNLKKDLIYIGEYEGGCTADDDFFNICYDYEIEREFKTFRRFDGIHDDLWLIKFSGPKVRGG